MLASGGAVNDKDPDPIVYDKLISLWSISNAWVTAPGRTSATEVILEASGVATVNVWP